MGIVYNNRGVVFAVDCLTPYSKYPYHSLAPNKDPTEFQNEFQICSYE